MYVGKAGKPAQAGRLDAKMRDLRFSNRRNGRAHAMETVNFLLDRPLALLIVMAIGGVIGIALERIMANADRKRREAYWHGRNAARREPNLKTIGAKAGAKCRFRRRTIESRQPCNLHRACAAQQVGSQGVYCAGQGGNRAQPRLAGHGASLARRIPRQPEQGRLPRGKFQTRRFRADGRELPRGPRARISGLGASLRLKRRRPRRGEEGSAAQGRDRISRGGRGAHHAGGFAGVGGAVGDGGLGEALPEPVSQFVFG